jgi:hypothetical protein
MGKALGLVSSLLLGLPALATGPARGPVAVCVVAAPAPGIAPGAAALEARRKQARVLSEAFAGVSRELNTTHGKDLRKWPPEAKATLFDAFDAQQQAWVRSIPAFVAPAAKDLADSVQNVKESLRGKGLAGRKEYVALLDGCEAAAIVLEVAGRMGGSRIVVSDKFLLFTLRPGPKLPEGAFSSVPADWGWSFEHFAWTHRYKDDAPFFQFEAWDDQRWRDVANWVSAHLDHFVKDNYDALKPAAE